MKKTFIRIVFSVFTIAMFVVSLYGIIDAAKSISFINNNKIILEITNQNSFYYIEYDIKKIIFFGFCTLNNIIIFLIVNFKDLQFLTSSLIKTIKEHRASTAEQRKAKKQAKLAQEIAEKQAELDEMKKDLTE